MPNTWTMPIKNRIDMLATGVKTPVGVKVSGPDPSVIARVDKDVDAVVRGVPGTVAAYPGRQNRVGDADVDINERKQGGEEKGATVGVSLGVGRVVKNRKNE